MHSYVDNIQTMPPWIKIKQENLEIYMDHVYFSVIEMCTKWGGGHGHFIFTETQAGRHW